MVHERDGFTLLEVCLAIFIGMLLVMIAVPSIQGVVADQNARRSFDAFDALVRDAQNRSITERRVFVIAWDRDGVLLRPLEPVDKDEAKGLAHIDFTREQTIVPEFPAALVKNPPKEWTFWPTGTCEPAVITGRDNASEWSATYDPLTVRAKMETK